jgi:hypothetical protein
MGKPRSQFPMDMGVTASLQPCGAVGEGWMMHCDVAREKWCLGCDGLWWWGYVISGLRSNVKVAGGQNYTLS